MLVRSFQLRSTQKAGYLKTALPTSMRYEGEWFYIKNLDDSAPCFTGWETTSMDDWNRGVELDLKVEVDTLLLGLKMLKEQGITGARLVRVFMHR